MIPMEGLTESSPNIILYPRLVNTTKGRIVVYSEAEHKEKAPDQYEEARIAYESSKSSKSSEPSSSSSSESSKNASSGMTGPSTSSA